MARFGTNDLVQTAEQYMMRSPSDHGGAVLNSPAKIMANVLLSADLLEALPDAVVAVDRDGITDWSER